MYIIKLVELCFSWNLVLTIYVVKK